MSPLLLLLLVGALAPSVRSSAVSKAGGDGDGYRDAALRGQQESGSIVDIMDIKDLRSETLERSEMLTSNAARRLAAVPKRSPPPPKASPPRKSSPPLKRTPPTKQPPPPSPSPRSPPSPRPSSPPPSPSTQPLIPPSPRLSASPQLSPSLASPPLPSPPSPRPTPTLSPSPAVTCTDQNSVPCATWARQGACAAGYYYLQPSLTVADYWCRKTCGACVGDALPPPPPRPCVDDPSAGCDSMKSNGYCDPRYSMNGQSVKDYWCPRTCGSCIAPPNAPFPPPAPEGSSIGGCADPEASLALHNTYRALHGSAALGWDNTLAQQALNWASNLALNNSCGLYHEGVPGENLYAMWSFAAPVLNCSRAVDAWYDEIKLFNFTSSPYTDNNAQFSEIGHFTQVVWASTARVGCAAVRGMDGNYKCYVVACRYAPPGNYQGNDQWRQNVKPPISGSRRRAMSRVDPAGQEKTAVL